MNQNSKANASNLSPSSESLTRRRFAHAFAIAAVCPWLPGCGGGGSASATTAGPTDVSPPASTAPPAPPPIATTLTTLAVRSTGAGTFPYAATVLPLRGQLPAGRTFQSPDDGALVSTVLSTHDDGSAAVVIVAGQTTVNANADSTIRLQAAAAPSDTPLTASTITAAVSSVSVSFGSPYGTATITDFSRPERTWWASSRVICARFRVQPPTLAGTALEAVIDIHAFPGGRALVEVVVENAKWDAAGSIASSNPASASYASAVVTVNGSMIATVNGNGAPEGTHRAQRAWYASTWVGGNPGLRVVQSNSDLQKHPLLFELAVTNTADLGVYANDAYTPWTNGRYPFSAMGYYGDSPHIGALPKWETYFLSTGDYRVANAVEATALAALGYNINSRDSATGLVANPALLVNKGALSGSNNWPRVYGPNDDGTHGGDLGWDVAHAPAVGLMAFICRPSPVFIELAQKAAVWQAMWSSYPGEIAPGSDHDLYGTAYQTTTGFNGGYFGDLSQVRGKAWGLRAVAHATFLTPDVLPWKSGGRLWLDINRTGLDAFRTKADNPLNVIYPGHARQPIDPASGNGHFDYRAWMHYFLVAEIHKIASARLLSDSTQQSAFEATANWLADGVVRYVNEQPNGGWRYIWGGFAPCGRTDSPASGQSIGSSSTWGATLSAIMSDSPPSVGGDWYWFDSETSYAAGVLDGPIATPALYPAYFYAALVASVERNVSGGSAAWTTVQSQIRNFNGWLQGFAKDARWGPTPRL